MKNMKKKWKTFALVAAVAAIGGYGVYANQKTDVMSDLMLANVEALAKIEDPEEGGSDVNPMCPNGCLSNGKGCLCHVWHPVYREAK